MFTMAKLLNPLDKYGVCVYNGFKLLKIQPNWIIPSNSKTKMIENLLEKPKNRQPNYQKMLLKKKREWNKW